MKWPGAARGGAGSSYRARPLAGPLVAALIVFVGACYSTGDGTAPPTRSFYYPTGLAVSKGGSVLYVVNSDFDLQYNGGTLQSYDLLAIRANAARAAEVSDRCPIDENASVRADRTKDLGEACAPPVDSTSFVRDSAIVGAFATDVQLSTLPPSGSRRLLVPVRGDASLTWADVVDDAEGWNDGAKLPAPEPSDPPGKGRFDISCGVRSNARCDAAHRVGSAADEYNNLRKITMPGEPFGMAQTEDGKFLAITHQSATQTSLFSVGTPGDVAMPPALSFVLDGVTVGGNGIAAVPLDPKAFACKAGGPFPCDDRMLRPAFLQTTRAAPELSLLRFYGDEGFTVPVDANGRPTNEGSASVVTHGPRPFLVKEATYPITVNASGVDSRGIVIDPSPRIACKLRSPPEDEPTCARRPARVFIANRSPASLLIGEVGDSALGSDGSYNATRVNIHTSLPLTFGPSRLYLAPIVDKDGLPALRLFIVCFDSSTLFVYDPEANAVENIIRLAPGPFAMAFDPFSIEDVVRDRFEGRKVPEEPAAPNARRPAVTDERHGGEVPVDLKRYRFAYVASFTRSYVQVLDLDNSRPTTSTFDSTFETVVYTLGKPALPKGSN